jgi:hypothetical protein
MRVTSVHTRISIHNEFSFCRSSFIDVTRLESIFGRHHGSTREEHASRWHCLVLDLLSLHSSQNDFLIKLII